MMLSAAQVNHWVVMYDVLEEGETGWSKASWLRDKEWIAQGYNSLANLPFLIDCRTNMVLVQSNAIMSFLGRELRMLGRSPPMTCRCEELLCEIMDIRNLMVGYAYNRNVERSKQDADLLLDPEGPLETVLDKIDAVLENAYPGAMEGIDELLDRREVICFLVGDQISAPDFCLWEMLDQFRLLSVLHNLEVVTQRRPFLQAFYTNFRELEENQPYFHFDALYGDLPLNNPYARFGSEPESYSCYVRNETPADWRHQGILKEERVRTRPSKRHKLSHSQSSTRSI